MTTTKQVQAARRNIKKAAGAAEEKRSIANMPAKTRSALGKQGAAVAERKRRGAGSPKTRRELYEEAKRPPQCRRNRPSGRSARRPGSHRPSGLFANPAWRSSLRSFQKFDVSVHVVHCLPIVSRSIVARSEQGSTSDGCC